MANATTERCFTQHAPFSGPPLIQNGQLTFQAHDVGWIVAGFFTVIATAVSLWLISKHVMWYTKKRQQRYIVRLLLMVPIYAVVSLASFVFWNHAIPITLVRDSYESFVLYSFFYLLLQYLSPTTEGQKDVFRNVVLQKWIFPLGFVKYRPVDGLYFLQLMKWGVLQYCVVRPTTTLAAVILDFIGLYCDDSWSPGWGHVYITIIVSLSVTIAMYCLFQLYLPIAEQLAPHKPLLKLFSVKAVVFLTFWQATGLSALSMFGVVKDTKYMTADDINTGIAAILETFEMMCFAFLHIRAFSYIPYRTSGRKPSGQTPRLRSFIHALDIRDMWREIRDGSVYMGRTIRGVEAEEETRRRIHFAKAMGRERELTEATKGVKGWLVEEHLYEESLLLGSPGRAEGHGRTGIWLSESGDRFGGAFKDEVERELRKRELAGEYMVHHDSDLDNFDQGHMRGKSSWWRGIYDRLSQSGPDRDREERLSPIPHKPSHNRRRNQHHHTGVPSLDSPPPPPSIVYEYSGIGNGSSSVRLPSTHRREQLATHFDGPTETRVGYHFDSRKSNVPEGKRVDHSNMYPPATDRTFLTHGGVVAPRPVSISQNRQIELLVSSQNRQLSPATSTNDTESNHLLVPTGVIRSDSLLARVFPNSSSATVDGQTSSDGRTDPASSQDTHPTPVMYPSSLPQSSLKLAPPPRGSRAFSTPMLSSPVAVHSSSYVHALQSSGPRGVQPQYHWKGGQRRPNIVLPAPLSPARYPVEAPRREPEHSPPQSGGHPPLGTQQTAGQHDIGSQSFSKPFNPVGVPSGPLSHNQLGRREESRRHSGSVQPTLAREPRTKKRMSAPIADLTTSQHRTSSRSDNVRTYTYPGQTAEVAGVLPEWGISSERSWAPASSIANATLPVLTTSPTSPSPPRQLRHVRGNIGIIRRPWS